GDLRRRDPAAEPGARRGVHRRGRRVRVGKRADRVEDHGLAINGLICVRVYMQAAPASCAGHKLRLTSSLRPGELLHLGKSHRRASPPSRDGRRSMSRGRWLAGLLVLGLFLVGSAPAAARVPGTRTPGMRSHGARPDITVPYLTNGRDAFHAYSVAPLVYSY